MTPKVHIKNDPGKIVWVKPKTMELQLTGGIIHMYSPKTLAEGG